MPDLEEEDEVRGPGELDARLANSNESRALGCKPVYEVIVFNVSRSVRQLARLGSRNCLSQPSQEDMCDFQNKLG